MPVGTWFNGVQVVNPSYDHDGRILTDIDIGAIHELLDGSIAYDYVGTRRKFHLSWNHITSAEGALIRTAYLTKTAQTFSPPDNDVDTFTVLVVPNTWRSTYIEGGDGNKYYNVEMDLEEVTAWTA